MSGFWSFCRIVRTIYRHLYHSPEFKSLSLRHSPVKTGEFFSRSMLESAPERPWLMLCMDFDISCKNCVMRASPFPIGRGHDAAGSSFSVSLLMIGYCSESSHKNGADDSVCTVFCFMTNRKSFVSGRWMPKHKLQSYDSNS